MFKKVTLILISTLIFASTAAASDDLLDDLATNGIENVVDASAEVEDFDMDIDVDDLVENADGEEDAVEACFRRFGYRSYGGGYGYRSYGYNHCGYSYSYYRPLYCQPVYHNYSYCAPVHYWGCY